MDGSGNERLDRLYRTEVRSARQELGLGNLVVTPGRSAWLLAILGIAIALAFIGLLLFGSFARQELVRGAIVPIDGTLDVESPAAGTIADVMVVPGQWVERDQVILVVTGGMEGASGGNSASATREVLERSKAELERQERNQHSLSATKLSDLERQSALLATKVDDLSKQMLIVDKQVQSARRLLDTYTSVRAKGVVTSLQVEQQNNAVLGAESDYLSLTRQYRDAQNELGKVRAEIARLPLENEADISAIHERIETLQKDLIGNDTDRAFVVKAPRSGYVSAKSLAKGQMVSQRDYLVSITPSVSGLSMEFWVPSQSVGDMAPGSRVKLDFPGFSSVEYGVAYGNVTYIAPSAVSAKVAGSITGKTFDGPVYRVLVRGKGPAIEKRLRIGMEVDGHFLSRPHRLWQWILEPLGGLVSSSKDWH